MTDHLGTNSAVAKSLCAGAQEARTSKSFYVNFGIFHATS